MIYTGDYRKGEIEITEQVLVFENKYVEVYDDKVLFPSGDAGTYVRINCKPSRNVAILPVTNTGKIVFIKTYRHGARGWGLEIPKGAVENEESDTEGALRELSEETGYVCKNLISLGEYSESPAIFEGRIHCYIATECTTTRNSSPEKTEAISDIFEISIDDFLQNNSNFDYVDALSELLVYKYIANKGENTNG